MEDAKRGVVGSFLCEVRKYECPCLCSLSHYYVLGPSAACKRVIVTLNPKPYTLP